MPAGLPHALAELRSLVRLGTPVVITRRGGQAWRTAMRTSVSAPPAKAAEHDAAAVPGWVATPEDPVPLPAVSEPSQRLELADATSA